MSFNKCEECSWEGNNGKLKTITDEGWTCPRCFHVNLYDKKTAKLSGANDGGINPFYWIPAYVKDVDDLAEYLELDGFDFNILKSLWANKGDRHSGTNAKREATKCVHYAKRRLGKLQRKVKNVSEDN